MKRNARAFGINRRVLLSTAVLLSTPPLLRIASTLAQDASQLLTVERWTREAGNDVSVRNVD
jgi:hypothetical protein